jgi:hypothetical protein
MTSSIKKSLKDISVRGAPLSYCFANGSEIASSFDDLKLAKSFSFEICNNGTCPDVVR